jgi:hypothetical protein
VRHGSWIIMLGALLGVASGGIVFALDGNLLWALGAATLVLLGTAVIANRPAILDRPTPSEPIEAPPAPIVETQTPLSRSAYLAGVALAYLTVGSLMLVWTGVWWYYLEKHPPSRLVTWYMCYGLIGTGVVLVVLAPLVGPIGRMARKAELPPVEAMPPRVGPEAGSLTSWRPSSGERPALVGNSLDDEKSSPNTRSSPR